VLVAAHSVTLAGKLKDPGRRTFQRKRSRTLLISIAKVTANHSIVIGVPRLTVGLSNNGGPAKIGAHPVTSSLLGLSSVCRSEGEGRE
jgi:hypothetical protein